MWQWGSEGVMNLLGQDQIGWWWERALGWLNMQSIG